MSRLYKLQISQLGTILFDSHWEGIVMKRCVVLAALWTFAVVSSLSAGEAKPSAQTAVPQEVHDMMGYLAGFWKIEGTVGGMEMQGTLTVRWSMGDHCQLYNGRMWPKGDRQNSKYVAVICGYDAEKNQAVETAYWSDGSHSIIRYNMSPRVVDKGEITGERVAETAGKKMAGKVICERKGPDEFFWTVTEDDGTKTELLFQKAEPPQRGKKAD